VARDLDGTLKAHDGNVNAGEVELLRRSVRAFARDVAPPQQP
jgi:hypothetical protein